MANNIEAAALFQKACDQQINEGATSGWMEANAGQVIYNGGKEIKIPSLSTSGLADYDRDNGFPRLIADSRETNKASLAAVRKAGYAVEGTQMQIIQKTKEKCSIVRVFCLL